MTDSTTPLTEQQLAEIEARADAADDLHRDLRARTSAA